MPYANPKLQAEYQARKHKKQRASWAYRVRNLLSGAKRRAKAKNLAFELSAEHVIHMLEITGYRCAVTGVEFDLSKDDEEYMNPNGPSIDKVDPKGGYTPANVRIVTFGYNRAKGEGTDEYMKSLAKLILKPQQELLE